VGESRDPQKFYFDLEHVKCGANAKAIYDALLNCLQQSVFSLKHLKENLISFVSDGASVMLGRMSRVAKLFLDDFPNATVWHCACHRLELSVSDAVDEVAGLNHLYIFCDGLYSLYHRSPKNQDENNF
jgi:hypothetical protein